MRRRIALTLSLAALAVGTASSRVLASDLTDPVDQHAAGTPRQAVIRYYEVPVIGYGERPAEAGPRYRAAPSWQRRPPAWATERHARRFEAPHDAWRWRDGDTRYGHRYGYAPGRYARRWDWRPPAWQGRPPWQRDWASDWRPRWGRDWRDYAYARPGYYDWRY